MTRLKAHELYMRAAVHLARQAAQAGERPFGCVVVDHAGRVVGAGAGSEGPTQPTLHSEMTAIVHACAARGGLLRGCTLYSTHEPCMMCCGAILHSKASSVVWGSSREDLPELFRVRASERRAISLLADTGHPPALVFGVLADECIGLFDVEVAAVRSAA